MPQRQPLSLFLPHSHLSLPHSQGDVFCTPPWFTLFSGGSQDQSHTCTCRFLPALASPGLLPCVPTLLVLCHLARGPARRVQRPHPGCLHVQSTPVCCPCRLTGPLQDQVWLSLCCPPGLHRQRQWLWEGPLGYLSPSWSCGLLGWEEEGGRKAEGLGALWVVQSQHRLEAAPPPEHPSCHHPKITVHG